MYHLIAMVTNYFILSHRHMISYNIFRNVDDLKELQKLRKRPKGVSLAGLATGK